MEVITEIMKASDTGKGQNAKTAEKPGAHGKDPQENEVRGGSVNCFPASQTALPSA